jgi:hypothetical protein
MSRWNFGELTKCTVFSGTATAATSEPWRAFRGYGHSRQTRIYILTNADTCLRMACSLPGVAGDTDPMIDIQPS